jgi:hypothetical protein
MKTPLRGPALSILVLLAGCGESLLVEPEVTEAIEGAEVEDGPTGPTDMWLISPPAGAAVPQNVESLGCPAHAYRGFGFELRFDWKDASDASGAPTYEIVVQARGAPYPAVHELTTESQYARTFCNAFVIDRNLPGWEWRVSARGGNGDLLWNEVREFRFEPCRQDGVPCTAPVGS